MANENFPVGSAAFGEVTFHIVNQIDHRPYVSVQQALEFNAAFLFEEDLQE